MKFPISSLSLHQCPLLILFIIPLVSAYIGLKHIKLKSVIHFQQGTLTSAPWRIAVVMCMKSMPPFIVWCFFISGPASIFYLIGSGVAVPVTILTITPIIHYIPSPSIVAYIQHRFQSCTSRKFISTIECVLSLLTNIFLFVHIISFLSSISPYSFYLLCPLVTSFSIISIIFSGHSIIMTIVLVLHILSVFIGLGVFLYFAIEDVTSFNSIVPMNYNVSDCFLSFFMGFVISFYQITASPSFYQIYFPLSTIYKLRLSLIFYGVFQLFSFILTFIVISLFTAFLERSCQHSFSYISFSLFTKTTVLHHVEHYLVISSILSLLLFVYQWNILYLSTHIWEEFAKFHFRLTSSRRQLAALQFTIMAIGILITSLAIIIKYFKIPYDLITISVLLITLTIGFAITAIYLCGYYFPCCNSKGTSTSLILSFFISILVFYLYFSYNDTPNYVNSCNKFTNHTSSISIRSFNMEKILIMTAQIPLQYHPLILFMMAIGICVFISFLTGGQDQMVLDWNLVIQPMNFSSFCLLIVILCHFAADCRKLIHSTALFRHGARAPTGMMLNESLRELFKNGLGELTDKGIEDSYNLGEFLKERYVKTGFLSSPFRLNEVRFFSRAINRCVMTANAVATAMYSDSNIGKAFRNTFVPVYTQERNDTLLNYPFTVCQEEPNYLRQTCQNVPDFSSFNTWPEYEEFVFECLKLSKNSTFFAKPGKFREAEALINEEKNGGTISADLRAELLPLYSEVYHFIIGSGKYHNRRLLRMKGGYLMHTVLTTILAKWRCYVNEGDRCSQKIMKTQKFVAYSTQDWILSIFMEILGETSNEMANNAGLPDYNSMILIELYDNNWMPEIEVFYKTGAGDDELINITPSIRGCKKSSPCHLSLFLNCCNNYTTNDPYSACMGTLA
ncbi:unnamed protein product [Auanema sp. JU1783]|nr:unnamed protein product [Auanema sp. JU1783]